MPAQVGLVAKPLACTANDVLQLPAKVVPSGPSRHRAGSALAGVALAACVMMCGHPAAAATLKTLYSIIGSGDGSSPASGAMAFRGQLYGTTAYGGAHGYGAVFTVDPTSGAETIVYSFLGGNDGQTPENGLVALNGRLYGTTTGGGTQGHGTIFALDPVTGAEKVVWSQITGQNSGSPQGLVSYNGLLYANDARSVFSIDPSTDNQTTLAQLSGMGPSGNMAVIGGKLYGTTWEGGTANDGEIYSIDLTTGQLTPLYSFLGGNDGCLPSAGLIEYYGKLYGTTPNCGSSNEGTVFEFDPSTGSETVIYAPTVNDVNGSRVMFMSGMTALHGRLYATAATTSGGILFYVDPTTDAGGPLYSFSGNNDGMLPWGAMTALNDKLYGTTWGGGAQNHGTVFTYWPAAATEQVLFAFTGAITEGGGGGLASIDSQLFLTAPGAGVNGHGEIVGLRTADGGVTGSYSFSGYQDGSQPTSPVSELRGMLYGATTRGGSSDQGTIFALNPHSFTEALVYSFGYGDGPNPVGGLAKLDGQLYGISSGGFGSIFDVDPGFWSVTKVANVAAMGRLLALNGQLFGVTPASGCENSVNCGAIFSVDPTTGTTQTLYNFTNGADGANP
ncbi:MAG TPA: choice-of-anchor tandem repeat GloVer-containing protein, partial [Acetobacteraceae bacterium]|nr:choice-of-anchor tandem repeat GloVer-containing protein [Acetobacteraceae bacterium]